MLKSGLMNVAVGIPEFMFTPCSVSADLPCTVTLQVLLPQLNRRLQLHVNEPRSSLVLGLLRGYRRTQMTDLSAREMSNTAVGQPASRTFAYKYLVEDKLTQR